MSRPKQFRYSDASVHPFRQIPLEKPDSNQFQIVPRKEYDQFKQYLVHDRQPSYSLNIQVEEGEDFTLPLAQMAATLLAQLPSSGPTDAEPPSSRLELVPLFLSESKVKWMMHLHIEPTEWYKKLPAETRVKVGRAWIDKVRKQVASPFTRGGGDLVVRVPEYCPFSSSCTFATGPTGGCNKKHSTYSCAWPSPKKTGFNLPCGFWVFDELVLKTESETKYFTLMARENKEFSRDLLFVPTPVWFSPGTSGQTVFTPPQRSTQSRLSTQYNPDTWPDNAWRGHYTNIELVRMPFFWQQVRCLISDLRKLSQEISAVELIAFNFGEWESKRANDPYALECHGHAHLHLSERAHQKLGMKWEALRGRNYAPPNYAWDDACRLETLYVMPDEVKKINTKLNNLEKGVEELKNGMNEKFQGVNEKFQRLDEKFQRLFESLFTGLNLPMPQSPDLDSPGDNTDPQQQPASNADPQQCGTLLSTEGPL